MRFVIKNPKILAGLKNLFNFNKSNCNNQTVNIQNLTFNINLHPGGADPEGQMEIEVEGVEGVEIGQEEGTSGEGTVGQGGAQAQPDSQGIQQASSPASQASVDGVRRRNWLDWEHQLMFPLLAIDQTFGRGDIFNAVLEEIQASSHPDHGGWRFDREAMLEYIYNRTKR